MMIALTPISFIGSAMMILLSCTTNIPIVEAMATSSSSSSSTYDLLVIGGGAAGLTAAKFAATFGNSVAIIEKSRMGGDCTWTGCIPSKTLIASAKAAHSARKASDFGVILGDDITVDMNVVRQRIRDNIAHVYQEDDSPEAMKKLGIDTISGAAKFVDNLSLDVTSDEDDGNCKTVTAKYGILIATGAKPKKPANVPGMDSVKYITYEEIFDLDELPKSITVVGGGPIGCELAQAVSRLGAKVTVIASRLLPLEEPEVGDALHRVFEEEGIVVISSTLSSVEPLLDQGESSDAHSAKCADGQTVEGDMMLVATGREPVVEGMGIKELGIELDESTGGIAVNEKLMTTISGVYAAGDCTGDQQFTHYAGYQGAVGARNILLPFSDPGVMNDVPATTFTDPQVASVGMTEEEARASLGDDAVRVAAMNVKNTDRGICDGVNEGLIKIVYQKKNYQILGATIMSPSAGEMIAEIGVAMKTKLTFDNLATVMHTYPSYSFALQAMAAELYYEKLARSKGLLKFLKRLGL